MAGVRKHRQRWPGGVISTLVLALVCPLAMAQTPPGTEIINVATSNFLATPPTGPPGGSLPAGPVLEVISNEVRTRVTELAALEAIVLAVDPAGTVAPGTLLDYTLTPTNGSAVPLTSVQITLPLDPGLGPPVSWTDGSAPLLGGGSIPVTGSYDPTAGLITWDIPVLDAGQSILLQLQAPARSDLSDALITMMATLAAVELPTNENSNTVVTPVVPPVLSVLKVADRPTVAPGDGLLFDMIVRHEGDEPDLAQVELVDILPKGLSYVDGSARVDGAPVAVTVSDNGKDLRISLGPLLPGEARLVQIAAIVGPVAKAGDVVNTAHAEALTAGGLPLNSPPATASVQIIPGPFRREAYLIGRVFIDMNRDGRPGPDEPGVPGAHVVMEDGRGALTDVMGRWHLEGVLPGLHVARVDPGSLPDGLELRSAGADWVGDPDTRFFEARASNLVILDFPVGPPESSQCAIRSGNQIVRLPVASLVDSSGFPSVAAERFLEEVAAFYMDRQPRGVATTRFSCFPAGAVPDAVQAELHSRLRRALAQRREELLLESQPQPEASSESEPPTDPLEHAVRTVPATASILSPTDGSRMVRPQVDIEVAYPAGFIPALSVNNSSIASDRIGTTSVLPSRGVAAARYVGVPLEEGTNQIRFQATPPDGNGEGVQSAEIMVILPGPAVGLRLSVPDGRWVADGQTPGALQIHAIDSESRRTVTREVITLMVEGARPMGVDLDPEQEGFQVRLSQGEAVVKFAPLLVAGQVQAIATAGEMEQELIVTVVPGAGEWRVFGLAEGRLAGDGGVEGDGGMPTGLDDGITESGARLAVMARGPVGNGSRLTVSVDTDREPHEERLFDFAPDAFYPVAGDTSVRLDEAQTQGKVFARLDAPAGYLQWGDFTSPMTRTQLSRYDRRLNGLSGEGQWGKFGARGFAAPTEQHQVRDVFSPDGTSGPYLLRARPVVARSEKVFIETRDRFRLEKVLAREVKMRDIDYSLDPVAGTILFRGPVAPFDANFNPIRVVVLYEYHGGDDKQVAAGTRVSYRPVETFEAGASAVYVERVGDPHQLIGVDLGWQPGASTSMRAEATSSDNGEQTATAYRLDITSQPTSTLALEAIYQDLPLEFENPSLLDSPDIGTRKASAAALWEPSKQWRLKGDILDKEDEKIDLSQTVAAIETERRFHRLSVMGAFRGVKSDGPVSGDISSALVEAGIQGKLSSRWTGSLIRRQVVTDESAPNFPTRTQIGISYQIREGALAFLRHEIESGGLVSEDRTLVGIESRVGRHTKSFARYALQEGNAGSSLRATTGVETVLPLSPSSTLNLMVSRLDTTKGIDTGDFTTLAAGYEHRLGSSLASGRYEVRLGAYDTRHLLTAAVAWRPPGAWTYFGRERVSFLDPDTTSGAIRAEGLFGLAYRPLGRMWRFLSRLEHSTSSGISSSAAGVTPGIPAVPGLIPPGLGIERPRQDPAVTHDSVAMVLAAGARLSRLQRLGATLTFRLVDDGTIPELPATLTDLLSLHYTATVHRRWTVGGSVRRFAQEHLDETSFGAGIEVGYLALKNLWLTGGYNVLGFSAPAFPGAEHTDAGPFVSFRFKFDESNLVPWRDTRLDHP